MSVCLHLTHTQTPHSLPCGFLHYCSCASIRYFPKLHIVPSGYYYSTKKFQTTQYFSISLPNTGTQHFFSLFFK